MLLHFLAVMAASQSLLFMAGAMPAPCSGGTTSMTVTTPAELQSMITMMNCTGEGTFDVVWTGTVPLLQVIEVSQMKHMTVTGSSRALAEPSSDVMDAGSVTGIFQVSNGSTLTLNSMTLDGGTSRAGAAIEARDDSFVRVVDCTFTNNNATEGGAIYANTAEIQIDGDTVFVDNSAQLDGGAIFATESEVYVDGNTTFANNSAGNNGVWLRNMYSSCFPFLGLHMPSTWVLRNYNFAAESPVSCDVAPASGGKSNVSVDGYSSFENNKAGGRGGGLYSSGSSVHLTGVSHSRYNSAQDSGGAIFAVTSKLYLEGSFLFANNTAIVRGGAISGTGAEVFINSTTLFTHNSADDKGGAVAWISSELSMAGEITFERNTALARGGAMFAGASSIHIDGQTWFGYNSAQLSGGALQIHTSSVYIGGYSTFTHNSAGEDGGALMSYSKLEIEIVGTTIFSYNSAVWRGGAIVLTTSELRIRGNSSFMHNTAYDGGAIAVQQTPIYINGSTRFVFNSAGHDGGAMLILGSNATIMGEVEMRSNTAFNGGGVYSALSPSFQVAGNMSFSLNQATFYGGAISMTDPAEFRIVGATFESNRGTSGGAVYLASTTATAGGFERCRFDGNEGTDGGALYVDTGDSGETQHTILVQYSVFVNNAAVSLGGALFNAGGLEISDTAFSANTAGEGGLAVHDEVSLVLLSNVTFRDNMFSCPRGQYSDAHHVGTKFGGNETKLNLTVSWTNRYQDSSGTCRFALVCEQCAQGCEVNQEGGKVTTDTVPVCEDIPEGVSQSLETSLATFDLLAGYYRVSAESRVIRECYQQDACRGGTDHLNYCAIGYTGAYCAVCDVGYAPGVTNRCHECSEENRRWFVGLASGAGVFASLAAIFVVSHLLRNSEDESWSPCPLMVSSWYMWLVKVLPLSAIKIIVVVLQIIIQFTEIAGAVYPEEYEAFLSKMSTINLDIGFILSNSCIVTTDFYARLLFATVWPLVVLSVLFGTLFIARKRKINAAENPEPMMQHQRASAGLFILFFVYSSVSFTIFQTFVCDELDDGKSYLRADYSLLCTSDTHAAYEAYAAVMICVYPIGIPAVFAWWLSRNGKDLQKQGRDELAHLQSSRGLWGAYSPSCYYFEVVECFRRIVLTGAAAFVLPNSAEQIAIIFLLAVVFTFISESLSPFASRADMWLYRWGNAIILASMYVALLLKTQLADEDSQASAVMTALLISANIFLMVTVVVQAFLLMRGVYMARRMESVAPVTSSRSPSFALAAVANEPVG